MITRHFFNWEQNDRAPEIRLLQLYYSEKGYSFEEITDIINKEFNVDLSSRAIEAKLRRLRKTYGESKVPFRDKRIPQNVFWIKEVSKNPSELAHIFPKDKLPEVLEGLIPKQDKTPQEKLDEVDVEDADLVKSQIKSLLMANYKLKEELRKSYSLRDLVAKVIEESVKSLPPSKIPRIYISKKHPRPQVAMLEYSDWHIGEKVLPQEVLGVSEYNFGVFKVRIDRLTSSILEIVDIERNALTINKLVINMLGDVVTGEDIFRGQGQHIDLPTIDQVFLGADYVATHLLLPLAESFRNVDIYCIRGNHGRVGMKGQYHKRTNFDEIFYRFLQAKCSNLKNIQFFMSESSAMAYVLPEAPKFNHLLFHGDQVKSFNQIPFYGLNRAKARYVELMNMPFQYVHLGHFHQPSTLGMPWGKIILNGAAVGGDDFSVDCLQTASVPTQYLFGFNETRGKTWSYEIQLADPPNLKADKYGIYTPIANTDILKPIEIKKELKR